MTDQGPRGLIPGQSMLRAPYGMTPGVRAVLPGINDMSETAWNKPSAPEQIDLDAPIASQPPGVQPSPASAAPAESMGWELTDPDGNTVHLRSGAHKKRDAEQVQRLGAALMNHATNDAEKETAARAMEWGAAQIGQADIGDITKQMTHVWDMGAGNALKMDLQGMRSKANRGGVGGVPGPVVGTDGMPDPMSKFGHQVHKHLDELTNQILQQERQNAKYAAMSEHENQMGVMESELASGNAMAERGAVMRRLLEMTGKASRESEQEGITASAGKWAQLKNRLALWVPGTNPSLDKAYVDQFRHMIAVDRAAIRKAKDSLGRDAATRALEQAGRTYGPEAAQEVAHTIYGAISGNAQSQRYTPRVEPGAAGAPVRRPAPAAAQPAAAPDDNSDLYAP